MDLLLMLLQRFCVSKGTMDSKLMSGARKLSKYCMLYFASFVRHRGVVLYAMVCGILPFGDNQIHRLIAKKEVALQFKSPHSLSAGMYVFTKILQIFSNLLTP